MISVVPVALIVVPLAVARLLLTNSLVRMGAFVALAAYASARNYRTGEGPLSPKMPVKVARGKGIGEMLANLATNYEDLDRFKDRTFVMTESEAKSLAILLEASYEHATAIPALVDYLNNFPSSRIQ